MMKFAAGESQVRQLPPEDRARLAEDLLAEALGGGFAGLAACLQTGARTAPAPAV